MAKRKQKKSLQEQKKRHKQDQDSELAVGVFTGEQSSDLNVPGSDIDQNDEDWDNEEQDYELKPRNIRNDKKVIESLPIKTADGRLERVVREIDDSEPLDQDDGLSGEDNLDNRPSQNDESTDPLDSIKDSKLSPDELIVSIKEEIAELAYKLVENPEENISCLTRLRKMSESKNFVTSQLSIMALVPVLKSLAPAYRIRPLSELEKKEKVSKDVTRLRNFEHTLVFNYKAYVDNLAKLAKFSYSGSLNNKKITNDQIKLGCISAKAACALCLSSLRHFNYREDLFSIVCRRLNKKPSNTEDRSVFIQCVKTLEELLVEDAENGDISHAIVRLLCKSIRDKKFRVDESVINIFLSLSVLDSYNPHQFDTDSTNVKMKKKDRVHLSKKEKKMRKERKIIDEEIRNAEQAMTAEQRNRYQAEILKMILTLYLEILKAGTSLFNDSKNEASLLIAPVLEALSKYGSRANFDLLGDFLEVLREITHDSMSSHSLSKESADSEGGMYESQEIKIILLCIATSFSLVLEHMDHGKLPFSIDLSSFISSLHLLLADMALDVDLEFSHKSLRLTDPLSGKNDKPAVNVSTKAELLIKCLDCIFYRSRNGTSPRALAFTKRIYLFLLHAPEKTTLTGLKFIGKLMSRYGEGLKGLWDTEERISGEGVYTLGIERPDREVDLERNNADASTLWENVLLDKHYCQMVKDGSRSLMKNSKSDNRV